MILDPQILAPQVAGVFYPSTQEALLETLEKLFKQANPNYPIPKAIIAPHSGYLYSGRVSAEAFAVLNKTINPNSIKRVILLAPAHELPFMGIATHQAEYFSTPLGKILLDHQWIEKCFAIEEVSYLDLAFINEHTLEVQLPFLQYLLGEFTLVPLIIGQCITQAVLELFEVLISNLNSENTAETLIVISSDLCQYQPDSLARELDQLTQDQIIRLQWEGLTHDDASGEIAIKALLQWAHDKRWKGQCRLLSNSGESLGEKDKVVGYGAFHFY